jgi:Flp pilus assembly protein CpaB
MVRVLKRGCRMPMGKSRWLLVVSVGCGLAAVVLLNVYLARREEAQGTKVEIMKADRDLPAGTLVTAADFKTVAFPEFHLDAFRDPRTRDGSLVIRREDFEHVLQRPLRRDVSAGEFLLLSHFEPPLGPQLSAVIPKGKVAVTVPLDRATRSSELISPGGRVDVYAVTDAAARGGGGGPATELLLEDVTVLAVGNQVVMGGQVYGARRPEGSTVTLAVTPAQVPKLAPAAVGRVSILLALRPSETPE